MFFLINRIFRIFYEEGFIAVNKKIFKYLYFQVRCFARKIQHNYWLNNWRERRKNKILLKIAREEVKESVRDRKPLVSVEIPTYNRGKILVERTIPSVLKQTYQNFEIIIVGDHCTDNTEELLKRIDDKRLKFYNLPKRGDYPTNPIDQWAVAGVKPANKAIELCTGAWIARLDDDDEFSKDHIETLLNFVLEHDYEMVYGKVEREIKPNEWVEMGSYPLRYARICHSSVLRNSKLKFFKYDINAWKYGETDDWNMWRRMKEAGVRIGFIDKIVGKQHWCVRINNF